MIIHILNAFHTGFIAMYAFPRLDIDCNHNTDCYEFFFQFMFSYVYINRYDRVIRFP